MSVLDRYVAKNFLVGYAILVFICLGLYVTFDLLVNFDEFIEDATLSVGQIFAHMADYYGYNLPLYYSLIGGPLLAVAGAFSLGNMLRNNEMTALIASGVPLQRIAAPVIVCTVLLIGLWTINKELVIPRIATKIARERDDVVGRSTEGVRFVRDAKQRAVLAQSLNVKQGRMETVHFFEYDPNGVATAVVDADEAIWDGERRVWRLVRGGRMRFDAVSDVDAVVRFEPVEEYDFGCTPEDLLLWQRAEWADMLSLRQMNALVSQGSSLMNLPTIIVNRHIRLTQPVLYLVLVVLTIPFFLTREPDSVLAGAGRSLALSGLFMLSAFIAHGIIDEQGAALRIWAPILCFGPLAAVQLANVKT